MKVRVLFVQYQDDDGPSAVGASTVDDTGFPFDWFVEDIEDKWGDTDRQALIDVEIADDLIEATLSPIIPEAEVDAEAVRPEIEVLAARVAELEEALAHATRPTIVWSGPRDALDID